MRKMTRFCAFCFLTIFLVPPLFVTPSSGQRADLSVLEQSIKQLQDPEWKKRGSAFQKLLGSGSVYVEPRRALSGLLQQWPEKSDEIKLALIRLLERENQVTKAQVDVVLREHAKKGRDFPHPFPDAEERSEYYANLIAAVTSLKDLRSLDALLGAINTGAMVTDTLAEFGNAALDRVLELFNSGDGSTRLSASIVLTRMLNPKNAPRASDAASRQKIKDALIRAASDSSRFVRAEGAEGLAKLGDPDVISLIRNLATSDPAKQVRDAANEALKKLR
jgi:hypothetical protein